ncbi:hypothetical protein Vadar_027577 [Vaccinium darrowii]|uniref:Uncharacterized protein n=1 Tax=Vaccinium darrowii TaxID=229202 RepID=A0ACB7Y9Z0_9ERIC|nr:hypothetical protein Vadar_027577 [Vaccinium darrowii]
MRFDQKSAHCSCQNDNDFSTELDEGFSIGTPELAGCNVPKRSTLTLMSRVIPHYRGTSNRKQLLDGVVVFNGVDVQQRWCSTVVEAAVVALVGGGSRLSSSSLSLLQVTIDEDEESMMPFSKANARRDVLQAQRSPKNENPVPDEAGPLQNAVELDLDDSPQKRPQNSEPDGESSDEDYKDNGFPIFMKDFGWGFKQSMGELKYLKLFPRPKVLMYRAQEVWQDKEPNWKKIYGKKAVEERQKLPPRPRKMKTDSKQVQTKFRTRCSPKQLVELNSQLTQSQRKALKKCNPFHKLLVLKCATLHRDFIMKLADRFNPDNQTLEFKNGHVCPITEEDVARVSRLPIGDIPVPIVCEGMHGDKMNGYFKEFKGIKLSALRDVVLKKKSDDKFQRVYMLFALGCFLCPTQKDVVGSRLFPVVVTDKMEKIKRYKWP